MLVGCSIANIVVIAVAVAVVITVVVVAVAAVTVVAVADAAVVRRPECGNPEQKISSGEILMPLIRIIFSSQK